MTLRITLNKASSYYNLPIFDPVGRLLSQKGRSESPLKSVLPSSVLSRRAESFRHLGQRLSVGPVADWTELSGVAPYARVAAEPVPSSAKPAPFATPIFRVGKLAHTWLTKA